jgi:hypothetical protein
MPWNAPHTPEPLQFLVVPQYPLICRPAYRVRYFQPFALPIRLESLLRPFRAIQSHILHSPDFIKQKCDLEVPRDIVPHNLQ